MNAKKNAISMMLTSVLLLLSLSACTSYNEVRNLDIYDNTDLYLSALTPGLTSSTDNSCPQVDALIVAISDEKRTSLRENLFMGEGEGIHGSGDELRWYRQIFGLGFSGISSGFVDIVGDDAFNEWTRQFTGHSPYGWRDSREANFRTFIEDFDITKRDLIISMESSFGMPMYELDALINWARYDNCPDSDHWAMRHSLSDIEALFSDCVYQLWEAFPGSGIVHNGRAYSPEWILNNVESAINEENIPLEDIERLIHRAYLHGSVLAEVATNAEIAFQVAAEAVRDVVD